MEKLTSLHCEPMLHASVLLFLSLFHHCMSPVGLTERLSHYTLCQTEKHLLNKKKKIKSRVYVCVCYKKCAASVFDSYSTLLIQVNKLKTTF